MKKIIYSFALAAFSIGAAFTSNASKATLITAGPLNSQDPQCTSIDLDCNPVQNTNPACTVGSVDQYQFDSGTERCITPLYKDSEN